jgi:hypothetical protein
MNILKIAIEHYKSEAAQYRGAVFDKIQKEIGKQIFSQLLQCFHQQVSMVRKQVLKEFELKIKKLTNKRDLVNPDFHEQSTLMLD